MGQANGLPKGGTTRINLSTQSLDMVISTFQVQDRDVQQAPILGQHNKDGWGSVNTDATIVGVTSTSSAAGEHGSQFKKHLTMLYN